MMQTDPSPHISYQLALEYIFICNIYMQLMKVSGTWGIFKTSKGIMKLYFMDFTPHSPSSFIIVTLRQSNALT